MKLNFENMTMKEACAETVIGGGMSFDSLALENGALVMKNRRSTSHRVKFVRAFAEGGRGSIWRVRARVKLGASCSCGESLVVFGAYEVIVLRGSLVSEPMKVTKEEWSELSFTFCLADAKRQALFLEQPAGAVLAEELLVSRLETECLEKGEEMPTEDRHCLWLIGDSIVTDYPTDPGNVTRGWGMYIGEHFDSSRLYVKNLARAGFSTRSFAENEGYALWRLALDGMKTGDFLMISHGINDHSSSLPWKRTTPKEYAENLAMFAKEAAKKGVVTLFVTLTPTLDKNPIENFRSLRADVMKEAAAECGVVCLDLNTRMFERMKVLIGEMGYDAFAETYFSKLKKADAYEPDRTHHSERGSRFVADMIVELLRASESELKSLLK